jgi:phage-related protein
MNAGLIHKSTSGETPPWLQLSVWVLFFNQKVFNMKMYLPCNTINHKFTFPRFRSWHSFQQHESEKSLSMLKEVGNGGERRNSDGVNVNVNTFKVLLILPYCEKKCDNLTFCGVEGEKLFSNISLFFWRRQRLRNSQWKAPHVSFSLVRYVISKIMEKNFEEKSFASRNNSERVFIQFHDTSTSSSSLWLCCQKQTFPFYDKNEWMSAHKVFGERKSLSVLPVMTEWNRNDWKVF